MINLVNRILNKFFSNNLFRRNLDEIRLQNGNIYSFLLKTNLQNIKSLDELTFKTFSQNNEDAILEYLILSLKLNNINFVEVGTEDYSESNTRFLYEKYNCKGLIIDNTKNLYDKVSKLLPIWKGRLEIEETLVNANNINYLLKKHSLDNFLDIFSIDIDGIDYWIIKELPENISKIFIAEYNPYFGPKLEVTVPNIDNFNRTKYHFSNLCWGMSLKALINLMMKKNYSFIGSNLLRNNAFFVKKEYMKYLSINEVDLSNLEHFTNANYRESKNQKGELLYLNPEKNLEFIRECEVFDIIRNKNCMIKDII